MRLTRNDQSIEIITSAASSTDVDVVWLTERGVIAKTDGAYVTVTAAATTTIIEPPPTPFNYTVVSLSVRNNGGSSQTVTVQKDVAGTKYTIIRFVLDTGESLHYEDDRGWYSMNASGEEKIATSSSGGGGGVAISAGTESVTSGTVSFANSNGITFGLDASTLTASHNGLTTAALSNHSHGNPQLNLTNLSGTTASNSAGFTLSLSAGNYLTTAMLSNAVTLSNIRVSAGTTSNLISAITFSNSNGITFGLDASTITASHNGLTTARASTDAIGLNTAQSNVTWTVNSAGLSLDARGYAGTGTTFAGANISGSMTLNSAGANLSLSVAPPGGGAAVNFSAGTTSGNLQSVTFADSNGVSFGLDAGTITATVKTDYLTTAMLSNAATISNMRISAGTTSNLLSALTFNNGNGITFGLDASTITASHNGLTTAMASNAATISNIRLSAGTTSNLASAFTFANGNGVSFGLDAGTITATVQTNYLTTAMLSNAATISNMRISAGTTSNLLSALTFNNGNGITFGLDASTVTASHNGLTTAALSNHSHGNPQLNLTNLSGTTASNSAGFTLSLSAANPGGGAAINVSAGTTSGNVQTLQFDNSNGVSFGLNGSTITATVQTNYLTTAMQSNAVTLSNIKVSAGTTSDNLSALTFSNSNGVSFGLNGSTVTASIMLNATLSQRLQWPPGNLSAAGAMGNGSFSINRMQAMQDMTATRMDVPFLVSLVSSAAANTWGLAVTCFGAIYTKNANTLSSLSSGSTSFSISLASNTAGTTQVIAHAIRPMSIPINVLMTPGEYYVGFGISTNTSSLGTATTALGNTWSIMGGPIYSSAVGQVGNFTDATNTSTGLYGGQGIYSAAISTVPPTVSLSAINQTGSYYARGNMGIIFRNI